MQTLNMYNVNRIDLEIKRGGRSGGKEGHSLETEKGEGREEEGRRGEGEGR